jgi:hypothetical protein
MNEIKSFAFQKNMLVDEVGEGNLLAGSTSSSKQKRPGTPESSSGDSSKSLKSSAPPRRKAGPLPNGYRREWRRRRRRRLSCTGEDYDDLSSVASDTASESGFTDIDSTPSLVIDDEDLEQPSSSYTGQGVSCHAIRG